MSNFIMDIHSSILDPSRFSILLMAIFLTAIAGMITGPMHGNANPFYWKVIEGVFGGIGKRLDRAERRRPDLVMRGLFVMIVALGFSLFIGSFMLALTRIMPVYNLTEVLALSLLLTSGTVWYGLLKLYFAMKEKKLTEGAFYTIARSSRTDLTAIDDYGITRTAMVFAARSFDKGLIAPSIWYLVAGLQGAFLYSALAALSWRFGRDGQGSGFGAFFNALEKLMGFVPMVLSGCLMAAAGLFTPTGGMTRAFLALPKSRREGAAPYEEGGLPVTAMAYALKISIGGPVRDIDGHAIKKTWVGPKDATARLEKGHLRRCIYISLMAFLLFVVSILFAMLYAGRLF